MRLGDDEHARWQAAADARGMTMTALVRQQMDLLEMPEPAPGLFGGEAAAAATPATHARPPAGDGEPVVLINNTVAEGRPASSHRHVAASNAPIAPCTVKGCRFKKGPGGWFLPADEDEF